MNCFPLNSACSYLGLLLCMVFSTQVWLLGLNDGGKLGSSSPRDFNLRSPRPGNSRRSASPSRSADLRSSRLQESRYSTPLRHYQSLSQPQYSRGFTPPREYNCSTPLRNSQHFPPLHGLFTGILVFTQFIASLSCKLPLFSSQSQFNPSCQR